MSLPINEIYRGCRIVQGKDRRFSGGLWHMEIKATIHGEVFLFPFIAGQEKTKQAAIAQARKEVDEAAGTKEGFISVRGEDGWKVKGVKTVPIEEAKIEVGTPKPPKKAQKPQNKPPKPLKRVPTSPPPPDED